MVSAVALMEVGRFREAVDYVQKAAKALYEAARDVFEHVKVSLQRLTELFVKAVMRVLAWVDKHRAYLFLMAAVAAGAVALSVALDMWGLVELEKLAHAAVGAPFVAGLADTGGKAAERFKMLPERYEKWKMDEKLIDGVLKAPLRDKTSPSSKRPYAAFLKPAEQANLPPPLVELRKALASRDEVVQDAAVVAALVLYKTLVKNAGVYGEWAGWYGWARGLVKEREFAVKVEEVKRLQEAQRRLEEAAGEARRELNAVLTLYALHSRDLYEKLRPYLEVDVKKAEGLAEARRSELSKYSDVGMGTKAYAALLSVARGGIYGHATMLLVGEGALADVMLLTPGGAYEKAKDVAGRHGEAVDPSRSPKGAVDWEDRAASALLRLLIGYGETDLKFRRIEKEVKKDGKKRRVGRGFQVFRTYGSVVAFVGELWTGKTAYFKVSEEELGRRVEEAKRTAPDLSGFDKAPQYVEWRATDVTTVKRQIVAGTAHPWQLRWYFGLFGEEKSFSGSASVTKEGIKLFVTAYWPREREDQILRESRWLEYLLGRRVESWRELVDAIDWSWVLKRVEELADKLKPWIGPEGADDAEREGLMRKMFSELALLVHFAEARRGMDDGEWREERAKKLARAVVALSGGRIASDHAERLARAIIRYAEGHKKEAKEDIDRLAGELVGALKEDVNSVKGEVWGVVEFVLSDMYCLARDCARDEVVRKFVAPALELVMLDKALRNDFDRERAKLLFGEMYATALAGDGHVGHKLVELTAGGELGGGAALLRLATLHLLNQLLPEDLKFNVRAYMKRGRYYDITANGEKAARFKRFLAVTAPSAGGEYLSEKFNEFVKAARVEVLLDKDSIRLTDGGNVAADLIISEGGVAVKYNVYLRKDAIVLQFTSSDQSRVELAAWLLKLAGVDAEVKKEDGRDVWWINVTTNRLAAGRKELRDTLVELISAAVEKGRVNAGKAEQWLEELERGRVLKEGWPKHEMGLKDGALVVRYRSPNPGNIEREAQRFRKMGLVEGVHFSVKTPEEGREGYVSILRRGLAYAAWLSVHGEGEQQRLAADFVEYVLQRAWEEGEEVYKRAREIIEEGKARGSLTLRGFERVVEVNGKRYNVKVIDGGAEFEKSQRGKKLLRTRITAEVDGIRKEYVITYGRYGRINAALGYATAKADAPEVREADAERLAAVVEALTGVKPKIRRRSDGTIIIECYREHLNGFMRYAELADAIERWLEETRR